MKLLVKSGRVIDPASKTNRITDILVEDSKIVSIGKPSAISQQPSAIKVIDAKGKIVIPGLIDMHTHLREPGHEEEETIATGTRAAAKGGITTVCCMPNTHPVIDDQTTVEFILLKAKNEGVVNVLPIGAITKGSLGEELSEIGELKKAGIVAISDDGETVMNSLIMRRALEYAKMFDLPVISHCEDKNLSKDGAMNEGYYSTILGLHGIPKEAEEAMVARDIILAELTSGHLHIAHISTAGSVELIRQAKKRGIRVTCETAPQYFTLTEEKVSQFDTNTKVNPPLRTKEDVEAIKKGLTDGTIDCIATDHAPHTEEEKNKEYDLAPFGIIGLETLLSLVVTELVNKKIISLMEAIAKVTINPAQVLKLNSGQLKPGSPADITIVDLNKKWKVENFVSKSKNSPFLGWQVTGKVVNTIVNGKIVYSE
ncbi:MAG TPA: dihydroorotase [Elusimicrobia bacterium]|jgi:dihydroorotase|nr:dihydroorotase [Elusimicrobiota bacterium]